MNTEPLKKIKELDGKQLYYSFLAGAQRIFENQKHLNKINVFPVPDADTGTNLASTMRSIMDAFIPTDNYKQTAVAMADAALTGARGNSGIIFAQFLYGFSNEIRSGQNLDIRNFAESMRNAVTYAYEAIANPVEGTILTVIKDWAEYLYALKDIIDDFIKLLIEAYERARQSLSETTGKLEVLARSNVVDAGAKGFVVFLEGLLDYFIKGNSKKIAVAETTRDETRIEDQVHEVITFRYCSEALITGTNLDKKKIEQVLKNCGDSLVIAGSPNKMRIHIHTDFPAELFAHLQRFGTISYQKVDDMILQNEIRHNRLSNIAVLTDSSCDLPKELLDKYQIHVVPLTVHFGESFYLDRITIQPPQFYSLLEKSQVNPTSAQPAYKEFQNKYEYLCTHYDAVIGVNISKGLSGTFANSEKASRDVADETGKRIKVFDSRNLSGCLGMIVLRVAREVEKGTSYEEILPKVEEWIKKSHIRVSVPTLKYIVRSGRVSPFKSFVAKILDLKPVIALDEEGKSVVFSKAFTEKGSMKNAIRSVEKLLRHNKIWEYAITHANNPEALEYIRTEMEKLTGKKPLFIEQVSPVLGANTGPGVTGISVMLE